MVKTILGNADIQGLGRQVMKQAENQVLSFRKHSPPTPRCRGPSGGPAGSALDRATAAGRRGARVQDKGEGRKQQWAV